MPAGNQQAALGSIPLRGHSMVLLDRVRIHGQTDRRFIKTGANRPDGDLGQAIHGTKHFAPESADRKTPREFIQRGCANGLRAIKQRRDAGQIKRFQLGICYAGIAQVIGKVGGGSMTGTGVGDGLQPKPRILHKNRRRHQSAGLSREDRRKKTEHKAEIMKVGHPGSNSRPAGNIECPVNAGEVVEQIAMGDNCTLGG